jgi:hypothetical protein
LLAIVTGDSSSVINRIVLVGLAVCICVVGSNRLHAAGYTFSKVVDQSMSPTGLKFLYYSVSNGTASVTGPYDAQTKSGLFASTSGPLAAVVKSGDPAPVGSFATSEFAIVGASISDDQFAFRGSYSGGLGFFRSNSGLLTTIAKLGDPAPTGTFSQLGQVADISGGAVAFSAEYGAGRGIFVGTGGPLTSVALRGDTSDIGAFTSFADPVIDGDTIGFFAQSASSSGVFTNRAGSLTTIAKIGDAAPDSSTYFNLSNPSVDNGDVVFRAKYSTGQGIFKRDGGPTSLVVKSGDMSPFGSTYAEFGEPAVSHGAVAFWARYAANEQGIFVANGGSVANVIKKGDSLFGGTIESVSFDRLGLDEDGSGRLIFFYRLTNGMAGLATANPVLVPEPHFSAFVLFSLAFFRRRSR